MALTYNKDIRDLSIKGTITTNTGVQIHLTPDEIINYSFDSQIGSEGLPLGSAESSSFSLEFSNSEHAYTPSMFDNAEVHMFIGIHDGSDYVYSDFGVWYVDTSTAPEQSVSISLSGYDALATRFESTFVDDKNAYPTTIGDIAETVCLAAGIRLKSNAFPNAAIKVSKIPAWGDDITLRDILSYCAICAGGYVRIARNGQLEIVGFGDGQTYEMNPDTYQTFTLTGGSAFKFNSIEAMMSEDAESYTRFAIDGSVVSDATNTIQIEYNPLLTNSIIQSVMNELKGIEMDAGSLTWGGDPSVQCTDYYAVTMIDGTVKKIMVTSQSFSVDGGMIVTETCELPSKNAVGSPTYSTSTNMYDAKGNIKATRIAGLDNKIIKATTGHFNNLTAETIEADALTVALLNALDLKAKNIDAESLTTDQLTALVANIVEGTIKRLNAGAITTDELYAAFAELIALKAKSITANNILTDEFAAEFAKITVLAAGNATFDKATIQHLVAQAMNLEYGVAGQVFVKNLAVEYAQMVGATIGELCIKASDGNYYLMDVNPDGTVTATKTTVSSGEANAGQTSGGKIILETNITAANLNAGNLLATYALINQIDAARIDVDQLFAREAFITALTTSQIFGGQSLTVITERASRNFRQEEMPTGEIKVGDTWVIPSEGLMYQAADASDLKLKFYLDADGSLYYEADTEDDILTVEGFDLYTDDLAFKVNDDGSIEQIIRWKIVTDLSGIEARQDDLAVNQEKVSTHFIIDDDMVRICSPNSDSEVQINNVAMGVAVKGKIFSRFEARRAVFGDMEIRRPTRGGLAFDSIGEEVSVFGYRV